MILRNLKLDLVLGNQNPIIDKFNEITKDLKVINENVYNDNDTEYIFYNTNNEWIFYQDLQIDEFWCNYERYWSIFECKLYLKYQEIQDLTKFLVEETLKIKVDTPEIDVIRGEFLAEETLKVKVDTPILIDLSQTSRLEETLKNKIN